MSAAGFECSGNLKNLKEDFVNETQRFLNEEFNKWDIIGRQGRG